MEGYLFSDEISHRERQAQAIRDWLKEYAPGVTWTVERARAAKFEGRPDPDEYTISSEFNGTEYALRVRGDQLQRGFSTVMLNVRATIAHDIGRAILGAK